MGEGNNREDMERIDNESLLEYSMGEGVWAFSTRRCSQMPCNVLTAKQVHGCKVAVIDEMPTPGLELDGYDAIVTGVRGLAIGVRTADCVPVLMYDSLKGVIAAVHSGWRGTVQRICQKTIFTMRMRFGSSPADIVAVLGPSIGRDSYQVGEEVVGILKEQGFPLNEIWYFASGDASQDRSLGHHIDIKAANRFLLEESGIPSRSIYDCGIDTFTAPAFFSARRETIMTGRTVSSIMLLNNK